MTATVLAAALAYAAQGWAVFPVTAAAKKSHKAERYSNGAKWGATRDPREVRQDFTRWPGARIGIVTGADSGIVVVETDTPEGHGVDGAIALAELEAAHGTLPETLQAISPSGSIHRYFKHPGVGIKVKCSASAIGPGIDVRGDGGMVVAPPSINLDGRRYRWRNRSPIAAMPVWLVALTREQPRASPTISQRALAAIKRPFNGPNNYGNAALEDEIAQLANTAPGGRNHALNRASFNLFQLVGGNELDGGEVRRRLLERIARQWPGRRRRTAERRGNDSIRCARRTPASAVARATMMRLRAYQNDVVDEYERLVAVGIRRIIIVAPTGSGKTVIGAEIIKRSVAAFKRVVFIAHRNELLSQARDKLKGFDVTAGIIKSGRDRDQRPQSLVQICGIQTLHARAVRAKSMELPPAEIVFVDEAHRSPAMTYQRIMEAYPTAIFIGLTATPCRGDGRGLGNVFEAMIECPQIGELITLRHLVPLRIFAPPPPDLRGVQVMSTGDYNLDQLSERIDPLVGDFVRALAQARPAPAHDRVRGRRQTLGPHRRGADQVRRPCRTYRRHHGGR